MAVTVMQGDALDRLREMAAASVHCIVTSPPYWRQRNYGVPGQFGLEPTPELYVERLVTAFREARRVLRDDGSLWLNVGDKWAGGGSGGNPGNSPHVKQRRNAGSITVRGERTAPPGYKNKDLIGLPWMLAFALRDDGWYLRSGNIWGKPNSMPESVRDRPSVAHEYVFQLSKSETYYYGYDDVRVPLAPSSVGRLAQNLDVQIGSARANGGVKTNGPMKAVAPGNKWDSDGASHRRGVDVAKRGREKQRGHGRRYAGFNDRWDAAEKDEQQANGAALRSVWWIAPAHTKGGHYAVMPDQLAALCILAGCPPGGTVLDCFAGAGTTGLVADRLGRHAVLIELNRAYLAMAQDRIRDDASLLAEVNAT